MWWCPLELSSQPAPCTLHPCPTCTPTPIRRPDLCAFPVPGGAQPSRHPEPAWDCKCPVLRAGICCDPLPAPSHGRGRIGHGGTQGDPSRLQVLACRTWGLGGGTWGAGLGQRQGVAQGPAQHVHGVQGAGRGRGGPLLPGGSIACSELCAVSAAPGSVLSSAHSCCCRAVTLPRPHHGTSAKSYHGRSLANEAAWHRGPHPPSHHPQLPEPASRRALACFPTAGRAAGDGEGKREKGEGRRGAACSGKAPLCNTIAAAAQCGRHRLPAPRTPRRRERLHLSGRQGRMTPVPGIGKGPREHCLDSSPGAA